MPFLFVEKSWVQIFVMYTGNFQILSSSLFDKDSSGDTRWSNNALMLILLPDDLRFSLCGYIRVLCSLLDVLLFDTGVFDFRCLVPGLLIMSVGYVFLFRLDIEKSTESPPTVESTVTGERMAADSVKDLAASRKCVAHLVATNLSLTVSDL